MALSPGLLVYACGARTGLYAPELADATDVSVRQKDAHEEDAAEEDAAVFIDATANCPPEATLIYITGTGGSLYSFWPPGFAFTLIGVLTCTNAPTHMTVDRHGVAWVVANGMLYRASTHDATCVPVGNWTPNPAPGFSDFALTFIGTTDNDTSLYVLGQQSLGLFDTDAGTFSVVGTPPITNLTQGGDMTSNGDGTPYFVHDVASPVLYDLDPKTAQIIQSYSVAATGGGSEALAYFGGRFYGFWDNNAYSYDTATQTTTSLGLAPIQVTGAGQSTCVPTTPTDAGAPD